MFVYEDIASKAVQWDANCNVKGTKCNLIRGARSVRRAPSQVMGATLLARRSADMDYLNSSWSILEQKYGRQLSQDRATTISSYYSAHIRERSRSTVDNYLRIEQRLRLIAHIKRDRLSPFLLLHDEFR